MADLTPFPNVISLNMGLVGRTKSRLLVRSHFDSQSLIDKMRRKSSPVGLPLFSVRLQIIVFGICPVANQHCGLFGVIFSWGIGVVSTVEYYCIMKLQ
jgi:hypothetical protein